MGRADLASLHVAVACTPVVGQAIEMLLELPAGATIGDAIRQSGVVDRWLGGTFPGADAIGVWGKGASADATLADGDRVELYRPLIVDPKDARRLRAARKRRSI